MHIDYAKILKSIIIIWLIFAVCSPNPCFNDGVCTLDEANYHCECPQCFEGSCCESRVPQCQVRFNPANQFPRRTTPKWSTPTPPPYSSPVALNVQTTKPPAAQPRVCDDFCSWGENCECKWISMHMYSDLLLNVIGWHGFFFLLHMGWWCNIELIEQFEWTGTKCSGRICKSAKSYHA